MLKILAVVLFIISNQSFTASKCQEKWDALKSVQKQLRHKSTEYFRQEEHRRHKEYQDCRKGKTNKGKKSKSQIKYKTSKSSHYKKQPIIRKPRDSFNKIDIK